MSARPKPSVVLFVDDVARLTRFYRDLAQMSLLNADADHAVLELDGIQLVIHALRRRGASKATAPAEVVPRQDARWKLCLPVTSIAAARDVASTLGGSIQPSSREWEARGFRACDGHDPEGNVIQVRETAA